MARQPQGIQSADAAIRILEVLVDSPRPMTLTELASAAGMTVSNMHRYLASLSRAGMLRQDGATGRYGLGAFALRLGLAALQRTDGFDAANRAMTELRDEIDMPVFLSVWTPDGPTMVRWLDASHPITVNVKPGSRSPLLSGASGKIFLAYEEPGRIERVLAAEIRSMRSSDNATSMATVRKLQELVRHHGVANVLGERAQGVNGISAPVFDAFGALAFAITSVGLAEQFDASFGGVFARAVRAAADRASAELGFDAGTAQGFAIAKPRAGDASPPRRRVG
jgi:DNA-binding IclR family transcriptional regulator